MKFKNFVIIIDFGLLPTTKNKTIAISTLLTDLYKVDRFFLICAIFDQWRHNKMNEKLYFRKLINQSNQPIFSRWCHRPPF